jgi:2-polyprenyl-3-methyl-5-hydroxy-6-metoxy-1,4-benzoquinol methylase
MGRERCQICGERDIRKVESIEGIKYSPGKFFDLMRCNGCGVTFIDIDTRPDFIATYYPENYKPHDPNINQTFHIRKTIMQGLRAIVFGKTGSRSRFFFGHVKRLLSWLYNKTAYRSIPFFRGEGILLDIGCGIGNYLRLLQDIGWTVYGVEPVQKAAMLAQSSGLSINRIQYEKAEYPEQFFDVVTMWHVLEHFSDSKKVLQKVSKMLKDDGLLLIGIPNYDSFDRKIFQKYWNGFEIPLHLYHFTPDSIRKVLTAAGFRCIKIIHTIRPTDMVSSFENFFGSVLKRKSFFTRIVFLLISIPISILFSVLNRSSIIVIFAKKNDSL